MNSYLFQDLKSSLGSAIEKANQTLDASDKGDQLTSDDLERAAYALQKTVESVVSAELSKSYNLYQLVAEATELCKSLRNKVS